VAGHPKARGWLVSVNGGGSDGSRQDPDHLLSQQGKSKRKFKCMACKFSFSEVSPRTSAILIPYGSRGLGVGNSGMIYRGELLRVDSGKKKTGDN